MSKPAGAEPRLCLRGPTRYQAGADRAAFALIAEDDDTNDVVGYALWFPLFSTWTGTRGMHGAARVMIAAVDEWAFKSGRPAYGS